MMAGSFLNFDDDDIEPLASTQIGSGLKSKPKKKRPKADSTAVAAAGKVHGFDRTTDVTDPAQSVRRGRPPLNEAMTYWRIYVSQEFRAELNQLRDEEGRRLNDVIEDMLAAYRTTKS